MTRLISVAILLATYSAAVTAYAAPIKYTYSVKAYGSLGDGAFTGPITITAIADTADVTLDDPHENTFTVPVSLATVEVPGFPKATFTIPTIAVGSIGSFSRAGFSAPVQDRAILFAYGPAFPGYDLKSEIGPVDATAAYNAVEPFATDLGMFSIYGVFSDVTFRATLVPEPSTATLLLLGMLVCPCRRRQREWKPRHGLR